MKKLLLTDLDGTVRISKPGKTFINDSHNQQIIPEAAAAVAHYYNQGWAIVGITNQGGVAFGFKTFQDVVKEQKVTLKLVPQLSAIYFCPWKEGEDLGCFCVKDAGVSHEIQSVPNIGSNILCSSPSVGFRKPNPGMLLRAIFDEGDEKGEIIYVGDRPEDEQAAAAADVKFIWASEWYKSVPL